MVAPMCWVIAPTSELTTEDPRMRSRRDVFPWSTCPITQTIGVLIFGLSAIPCHLVAALILDKKRSQFPAHSQMTAMLPNC